MRVKVRKVGEGLHPSEVIVEVQTSSGSERLVVDRRALQANSLSIGAPLGEERGHILVELPRETMTGTWRVWVRPDAVLSDKVA